MEFIQGSRVWDFAKRFEAQYWEDNKSKYYDLIVEGIQLLRRMPVPDNATPGPLTSSKRIIHHTLFKDDEAPIEYRTFGELQDHLNKVWIVTMTIVGCACTNSASLGCKIRILQQPAPANSQS